MHAEQGEHAEQHQVSEGQSGFERHPRPPLHIGMILAGLVGTAMALAALGDLRVRAASAIALMLLAAALYAVACWSIRHWWQGAPETAKRFLLLAVLGVAVSMRLILFSVPPTLSDDIYRYRWDGRVQANGFNPYLEPPAASGLESLRDEYWPLINYPRIRTIYPPLTQLLFATTYELHHSIAAFKVAAVLGDAVVMGLLWGLLSAWALPRWYLALYALHPLPAVEFASSGHFDAWPMAAVLAALLAHSRGRAAASTTLLAAGVLLKTWPLVFVPLLLRRRPRWHLALFAGLVAAAYLPFLDAGIRIVQPWLDYTGRWRFNDGAFWLLDQLTGSLESAKAAAAALGLGLLLVLWRRDANPVAGGYWLLLAFIALMPTVHPWYLLWGLPLAVLALDIGWITLCALAPVAYWILVVNSGDSQQWVEPTWPRFAEYLPAAALWFGQWATREAPAPGRTPPSP